MKKAKVEYTIEEAVELWKQNIPSLNEKLEKAFGIETFKPKNIMDLVKTFQDALDIYLQSNVLDEFQKYILDYSGDSESALIAQANEQLAIIVKVLNQGWAPDWANASQRKWFPYFYMSPFAFDTAAYSYVNSSSGDTSRLRLKSEDLAIYAGKTFLDIYKVAYSS